MDKGNKKDARRLHISCFESFDEMYFLRYPSESPFRGLSDRPFGGASAQNNTRTYVTQEKLPDGSFSCVMMQACAMFLQCLR